MTGPDLDLGMHEYDVYSLLLGMLLLRFGSRLWRHLQGGAWISAIPITYTYGAGLALVLLALLDFSWEQHGRKVAYAALFVLAVNVGFLYLALRGAAVGTDAQLFSAYAARSLLHGQNPFTVDMASAFTAIAEHHPTPRVDGTTVAQFSYPAGSFLAFVPQYLAGVWDTARLTPILATFVASGHLVRRLPREYALVGVIAFLAGANLFIKANGGVIDILWVAPLLGAIYYWPRDLPKAGICYGLAAAVKQTPWFIGPFLLVWLWHSSASTHEFSRRATRWLAPALTVFAALNLPFFLLDPSAWMQSVLTPLAPGVSLIHQGVGLAITTVTGVYPISKTAHVLLLLLVYAACLAAYYAWWDRLRWTAWIAHVPVLFVYYRSLNSYFVFAIPIAVAAYVASRQRDTDA